MIKDFLHIFYPQTYKLANGKEVKEKFNAAPYITIIVIIFAIICGKVTGFDLPRMFARGKQFWELIGKMFPPNWAFKHEKANDRYYCYVAFRNSIWLFTSSSNEFLFIC